MQFWKTYAEGLGFALLNATMMATMTTHDDIGSALRKPTERRRHVGLRVRHVRRRTGLRGQGYDRVSEIIANAALMVEGARARTAAPRAWATTIWTRR